jgi:Predicted transcriptional regulators
MRKNNNDASFNTAIGQWLANKREEKKLSQQEVADMLKVSKTAVSYWETGKRTIYAVNMMNYCEVLGVNPQDLVSDLKNKRKTGK